MRSLLHKVLRFNWETLPGFTLTQLQVGNKGSVSPLSISKIDRKASLSSVYDRLITTFPMFCSIHSDLTSRDVLCVK